MRTLCVIPPYVPSYFNAGHHLPLFQLSNHLRVEHGIEVETHDFGALNATWRTVCNVLIRRFDVVVLMNDFDAIDGFERFIEYCREISPSSRLITFGRASRHAPGFFEKFDLDAIGHEGDYEISIVSYLLYLRDGTTPRGVRVRNIDGSYKDCEPGQILPIESWTFPDIDEIPYSAYDRLYADDLAKFCGLPQRRELVVPVARGCPVGCEFCDVPRQQGRIERRLSVDRVVSYIQECYERHPFEYTSFYAPTFTLKRDWVLELCERLPRLHTRIYWKCVTTIRHLDEELIRCMGEAGCVRISVGVETTHNVAAKRSLPQIKHHDDNRLAAVEIWCASANIELNCFLMLGMPGEDAEYSRCAIGRLIERGHRVRPTLFTEYDRIRPSDTVMEFARFNRQLLPREGHSRAERDSIYNLMYANPQDHPTRVQDGVPRHNLSEPAHTESNGVDSLVARHCQPRIQRIPPFQKADDTGWLNLSSNELQHPELRTLWYAFLQGAADGAMPWRYPKIIPDLVSIARSLGMESESWLTVAPGGDAALRHCMNVFAASSRALAPDACYVGVSRAAAMADVSLESVAWLGSSPSAFIDACEEALRHNSPCLMVVENPNGLDGRALSLDEVDRLARVCSDHGSLLLVDEAYGAFVPMDHTPLIERHDNLLVLRTFSKSHGMAGLRLALILGRPTLVTELRRARSMNDVSQLALDYLAFALTPDIADRFNSIHDDVRRWRDEVAQTLSRAHPDWQITKSHGNFVVADLPPELSCEFVSRILGEHRIRARLLQTDFGSVRLRFTVGSIQEMANMLTVLGAISPKIA